MLSLALVTLLAQAPCATVFDDIERECANPRSIALTPDAAMPGVADAGTLGGHRAVVADGGITVLLGTKVVAAPLPVAEYAFENGTLIMTPENDIGVVLKLSGAALVMDVKSTRARAMKMAAERSCMLCLGSEKLWRACSGIDAGCNLVPMFYDDREFAHGGGANRPRQPPPPHPEGTQPCECSCSAKIQSARERSRLIDQSYEDERRNNTYLKP